MGLTIYDIYHIYILVTHTHVYVHILHMSVYVYVHPTKEYFIYVSVFFSIFVVHS